MPVATVDPNKFDRYELKTMPAEGDEEGGYVMLRPLPYGMLLEREDKTMKMSMKARRPQDRQRKGGEQDLPDVDLKTMRQVSVEFDFANCVGEHNLTDMSGALLDFSNPLTFKVLDPRVAQEIEGYIDELNTPEGEESAEDFIKRATSPQGNVANLPSRTGDSNTPTEPMVDRSL